VERARALNALHAAGVVVGSMIGTGVFTTTGLMLQQLGSAWWVLLIWAVAGGLALAGAVVYAELGAMMPRAGGEYVYLSRAFHPAVGFVSGWLSLVVGFAAPMAAGGLAFGRYLQALVPGVPVQAAALGLIAVATALHARDVRGGGAVHAVVTGLVVLVIVVFAAGAVGSGGLTLTRLHAPSVGGGGAGAIALSLIYVTYSYFGWNAAGYVAGEVRDAERTLPRAILAGTGVVTLLYLLLNAVFLASAPAGALSGQVEVADVAARALFGTRGGQIVSALVTVALAGAVSALAMTGPRVLLAMAQDGLFIRALARTNRRGAPSTAVLLQGALAAVGVVTAGFDRLLVYAGFALTLSSAATVAGAFVLRWREPAAVRPYRAFAWPYSGLLYLALALFMTVFAIRERPWESLAGFVTLLLGGLSYALWGRRSCAG
jgi:basic amino acid/polyamine antiporter, APA family